MIMAKRKSKRRQARRQKNLNLAGLAESALIANAVTTGFFNCGLRDFVMSTDGGGKGAPGMNVITARELLAGITGGSFGTQKTTTANFSGTLVTSTLGDSFGATVRDNLANNGANMVVQLVAIPAGFRVFSKLTRKPRSTLNNALKMSGLPLKV
jgi:hypothetical protein